MSKPYLYESSADAEKRIKRENVAKRKADRRKCPNEMKGTRCLVCGGTYFCLDTWRPKCEK